MLAEPPMVGRPQDRVPSQGHAGSLANGIDRPGIDADLALTRGRILLGNLHPWRQTGG